MSFYTLEPSYQPRRGYPAFSTGRDFFEPNHSYSPFSQPDESYYSAIAEEHERRAAIARQKAEEATVARLLAQQHREEQLRRQEYLHHLNTPSPFAVDLSQVFRRPSQRPSALETALAHSRFANRNPRPQRQRAIRLAPSSAPKSINDIFGVELNREEPYYLAELEAHKARKEKKALKARQAEQESLNAALSAQFEELVLAALNLATPSPAEEPQMAPKAESSSSKGKGRAEPAKPFNFANSNKSTESSKVTSDSPKNVDSSERERLELADAIVATNSALIELEQEFQKAKDSFAFPAHLDFSPPTPSSDSSPIDSVPSLLYTPANIELHFYENRLTTLLTKLDTVESHGIALIREARKGLAAKIEKELQLLDEKKLEEWKAQSSASRPVSPALIAVKSGDALAEEEDVDVSVSATDVKTEETEEVEVTPSASDSDKQTTSTADDQGPASLPLEDSTTTITPPHKDINEDNASSIATPHAPVDESTSEDLVSTPVESEPSQQLNIAFQPATLDAKDPEAPVFAPSEDAAQELTINQDSSGASNSPSELEFESSSAPSSPRDDFALLHDSTPSDKDESDSDSDIDGRTLTITPPYFDGLDDGKPELAKKEPAEVSREIGEDKLSDFEML